MCTPALTAPAANNPAPAETEPVGPALARGRDDTRTPGASDKSTTRLRFSSVQSPYLPANSCCRGLAQARALQVFIGLLAGLAPLAQADDKTPAAPVTASPDAALTPVELARSTELRELVSDGAALLDGFAKAGKDPATAIPQAEQERRVKEIFDRYESLLRTSPDHLETLLLYGKFLRATGMREEAFKIFLRADRVSPNLAVVKHQLGAHLAEEGDATSALPLLRRAVELAPSEARYHYDFAEFLSGAEELSAPGGPISRELRDKLMVENFAEAARLKPAEAGFRWRAAEAWYDVKKPDAGVALAAWDAIAREVKTDTEKEVVGLHRARWLVALARLDEARKLIRASTSPGLDASRRKLLDAIQVREAELREAAARK